MVEATVPLAFDGEYVMVTLSVSSESVLEEQDLVGTVSSVSDDIQSELIARKRTKERHLSDED
jgi:hypothetical protein